LVEHEEKKWTGESTKEKSNPLIPYPIVHHLYATLREFMASLEKSPAVLARGKPMNHHRMQNEGGGEETSQKRRRPEITKRTLDLTFVRRSWRV